MAEQPRTVFAQKALDFAELFALGFGQEPFSSGRTSYRVEMSAPEGPSTGGGKQVVQHITLMPTSRGSGSIVIGSANRTAMSATLRTFALLKQIHEQRAPIGDFALDRQAYEALCEKLVVFFENQGMPVTQERAASASVRGQSVRPAVRAQRRSGISRSLVLAVVGGALALGAVIWFFSNYTVTVTPR